MSALPPKADICSAQAHVRFGPKTEIGPTLDERRCARQRDDDFGKLARLRVDFD